LYAIASILAIFLGGLALGAWIGGNLSAALKGNTKRALQLFILAEIIVAVFAAAMPVLFGAPVQQSIWSVLAVADPVPSYALRIILAAIVLLIPTVCMGASFPLLVEVLETDGSMRRQWLYAVNTTGGALGAFAAGFVLLPTLGLQVTGIVATLSNILAAGLAACCMHKVAVASAVPSTNPVINGSDQPAPGSQRSSRAAAAPPAVKTSTACIAAFASGAFSLIYQIAWTRLFTLVLGASVYSVSAVLSLFLIGLAAGGLAASRWLLPFRQPLLCAAGAVFFSAVYCTTCLYFLNDLPWFFLSTYQQMLGPGTGNLFGAALTARFLLVAIFVLPPAVAMGSVLPLLLAIPEPTPGQSARRIGRIFAYSTMGCIVGSLLTGFVLIPQISATGASGIQSSLLLASLGQMALAVWLFLGWSRAFINDGETRMLANGIVVFVLVAVLGDVLIFRPGWNATVMAAGPGFYDPAIVRKLSKESFIASLGVITGRGAGLKFYEEGLNSTITVETSDRLNVIFLKSDGKVEAACVLDPSKPAPTADVRTHVALAALPVMLHKGPCRSMLVIGYGSGTTSGAALLHPEVQHLDIAELEPAVYRAGRLFAYTNNDPLAQASLNSGRVKPWTNDGRYLLLARPEARFDAIACQPSDPWVNGASELFTREFWQIARARLAPNGIFCQWLPLYSVDPSLFALVCRTFASVFPDCALFQQPNAGECILVGFNGSSAVQLPAAARDTRVASALPQALVEPIAAVVGKPILDANGIKRLAQLGAAADNRLNTDDNLLLEFATARTALTQQEQIDNNLAFIRRAAQKP
jgi:spermidine synthase